MLWSHCSDYNVNIISCEQCPPALLHHAAAVRLDHHCAFCPVQISNAVQCCLSSSKLTAALHLSTSSWQSWRLMRSCPKQCQIGLMQHCGNMHLDMLCLVLELLRCHPCPPGSAQVGTLQPLLEKLQNSIGCAHACSVPAVPAQQRAALEDSMTHQASTSHICGYACFSSSRLHTRMHA